MLCISRFLVFELLDVPYFCLSLSNMMYYLLGQELFLTLHMWLGLPYAVVTIEGDTSIELTEIKHTYLDKAVSRCDEAADWQIYTNCVISSVETKLLQEKITCMPIHIQQFSSSTKIPNCNETQASEGQRVLDLAFTISEDEAFDNVCTKPCSYIAYQAQHSGLAVMKGMSSKGLLLGLFIRHLHEFLAECSHYFF